MAIKISLNNTTYCSAVALVPHISGESAPLAIWRSGLGLLDKCSVQEQRSSARGRRCSLNPSRNLSCSFRLLITYILTTAPRGVNRRFKSATRPRRATKEDKKLKSRASTAQANRAPVQDRFLEGFKEHRRPRADDRCSWTEHLSRSPRPDLQIANGADSPLMWGTSAIALQYVVLFREILIAKVAP